MNYSLYDFNTSVSTDVEERYSESNSFKRIEMLSSYDVAMPTPDDVAKARAGKKVIGQERRPFYALQCGDLSNTALDVPFRDVDKEVVNNLSKENEIFQVKVRCGSMKQYLEALENAIKAWNGIDEVTLDTVAKVECLYTTRYTNSQGQLMRFSVFGRKKATTGKKNGK